MVVKMVVRPIAKLSEGACSGPSTNAPPSAARCWGPTPPSAPSRRARPRAAVRTGSGPELRKRGLGVQLAQRGWQVTGLDNVGKALERATERIRDAGAEMALVLGDVTRLHESDIGSGYRLVLDTGTFKRLDPRRTRCCGP